MFVRAPHRPDVCIGSIAFIMADSDDCRSFTLSQESVLVFSDSEPLLTVFDFLKGSAFGRFVVGRRLPRRAPFIMQVF